MRKYKFFLDFEKEEKWLNEMAAQGLEFTEKRVGYHFRHTRPENTNIKIDYRIFNKKEDFEEYLELFEDCGWKHISGTKSSGMQYFKQVSERASDDIFSDADSKAGRYKRMSEMYITFALVFLPIYVALSNSGNINFAALLNPKLLYYTPGLWEKTGGEFWRAFLFETPFAFFRGFSMSFIFLFIALYIVFAIKAKWQYHKKKNII